MVSLRRMKRKKSFVGEKRRSARLLALDVVGSCKSSNQMQWKGNNTAEDHEDTYHRQEIRETSNGNYSSNGTINQIIQHVLDVLELKDTHELFTMPDSMQIDDYTERVKNPSDFATLRQKNIDGMYTTLEQFENDVYAVFKKATTINDQNTIPYKQAIFLRDQARHVFQSFKNSRTYSKVDISGCHQKHVRSRKKLRQNDETAHTSSNKALSSGKPNNHIHCNKELGNVEVNLIANEKNEGLSDTKRYVRNVQLRSYQTHQSREEPHMAEPRLTYLADNDSSSGIGSSTLGNQNPYLAFNELSPRYQESLRIYTKNAGIKAQKAAEERCQMYTEKLQNPYFTRRPSIPQISSSLFTPSFDSTRLSHFFPPKMTNCKLETDELLNWFLLTGTPELFEKGNTAGSSLTENMQLKNKDKKPISQQHGTDFLKKGSEILNQKEISATMKETTSLKDNRKDIKNSTVSTSFNGIVSSQIGFGQYASLFKPFKSDV